MNTCLAYVCVCEQTCGISLQTDIIFADPFGRRLLTELLSVHKTFQNQRNNLYAFSTIVDVYPFIHEQKFTKGLSQYHTLVFALEDLRKIFITQT